MRDALRVHDIHIYTYRHIPSIEYTIYKAISRVFLHIARLKTQIDRYIDIARYKEVITCDYYLLLCELSGDRHDPHHQKDHYYSKEKDSKKQKEIEQEETTNLQVLHCHPIVI